MLALLVPALAQEPTQEPTAPPPSGPTRLYRMEVNARGRYLWFPKSLLDTWYFPHDEVGATTPARPNVAAYTMGVEFVVKDRGANGIFYVEYIGSLIEEGYWDDVENPEDNLDGSWIQPQGFGMVAIGANYAHEVKAQTWLSFLFGAGLGVAVKTGNLVEWEPGEDPANGASDNTDPSCGVVPTPAYERVDQGCADDGALRVPPVLPMVDINLGVRFTFSDRASLRLEAGLHDLPYVGSALGITF
jgi:hypothetical protein